VGVPLRESLGDTGIELRRSEAVPVGVWEVGALLVGQPVGDGEGEAVPDTVSHGEGVVEIVRDPVPDPVALRGLDPVLPTLLPAPVEDVVVVVVVVGEAVGEEVRVVVGEGEVVAPRVGEIVGEGEMVEDRVTVEEVVPEALLVGEPLGEVVCEVVGDRVEVALEVREGEADGVGVGLGLGDGVGLGQKMALIMWEAASAT